MTVRSDVIHRDGFKEFNSSLTDASLIRHPFIIHRKTENVHSQVSSLLLAGQFMTEHIDRNLLDTDLRYRFNYLSKFLNFTQDDISTLNNLATVIHPLIPTVVDTLYQKLLDFDITKHYFLIRSTGFDGHLTTDPNQLTLHCEQMMFRRDTLRKYLFRILRQRLWNDAFLQYLSHVGKIHTNMAGTHSIDIDYIHMNALLGYLEHILIDAILTNEKIDPTTKRTVLIALNKFFWIQNDFFTMHYIKASKKS